jgi:excisionase family DNA binding protein
MLGCMTQNATTVYTVDQVAEALGISRGNVFTLIRTGELASILIGKRGRRVTEDQLNAYIKKLEENT